MRSARLAGSRALACRAGSLSLSLAGARPFGLIIAKVSPAAGSGGRPARHRWRRSARLANECVPMGPRQWRARPGRKMRRPQSAAQPAGPAPITRPTWLGRLSGARDCIHLNVGPMVRR